jgi:HK97 family phage portal protein
MVKFSDRVKAFIKPNIREVAPGRAGSFSAFAGLSDSGIVVNEETAQKFSAVWLAMRIWSELPASLPVEVYEENGVNRKLIDHEVKDLLMKPNALMNRFTWDETMNAHLAGWGNGISVINRSGSRASSLMVVHPSTVKQSISDGRLMYKIDDKDMGVKGTFFAEEILHYRGYTTTGLWGKSPIQAAKDNISIPLAAEKFGARYFAKGGNLKSVIETDGHMSDAEFKEWKKRYNEAYSGVTGDHETPILEYGMKMKQLTIAPDAAQFIETRQFGVTDVARWFNLPPHMLADLTRATFSNIEHQDLQFVKYSLRPFIRRKEIELEEKLLLPKERGKIRIRYNLDGMLRGDLASVTQHVKEMVLSGVLSPDEGRGLLNRNPRPGGAEFYTPANIVGNTNTNSNAPTK